MLSPNRLSQMLCYHHDAVTLRLHLSQTPILIAGSCIKSSARTRCSTRIAWSGKHIKISESMCHSITTRWGVWSKWKTWFTKSSDLNTQLTRLATSKGSGQLKRCSFRKTRLHKCAKMMITQTWSKCLRKILRIALNSTMTAKKAT